MLLALFLSTLLLILGIYLSPYALDFEKLSAYECGFMPVGDARQPFHVRFYLVGVLFLLFDLEIIFLFPGAIFLHSVSNNLVAVFIIFGFTLFLLVGFFYEYIKGVLDWE